MRIKNYRQNVIDALYKDLDNLHFGIELEELLNTLDKNTNVARTTAALLEEAFMKRGTVKISTNLNESNLLHLICKALYCGTASRRELVIAFQFYGDMLIPLLKEHDWVEQFNDLPATLTQSLANINDYIHEVEITIDSKSVNVFELVNTDEFINLGEDFVKAAQMLSIYPQGSLAFIKQYANKIVHSYETYCEYMEAVKLLTKHNNTNL